jgi:hypothetical protein
MNKNTEVLYQTCPYRKALEAYARELVSSSVLLLETAGKT